MANSVFKIFTSAPLEWVLIPHRGLELFFDFRIFDSAPLERISIPHRALESFFRASVMIHALDRE